MGNFGYFQLMRYKFALLLTVSLFLSGCEQLGFWGNVSVIGSSAFSYNYPGSSSATLAVGSSMIYSQSQSYDELVGSTDSMLFKDTQIEIYQHIYRCPWLSSCTLPKSAYGIAIVTFPPERRVFPDNIEINVSLRAEVKGEAKRYCETLTLSHDPAELRFLIFDEEREQPAYSASEVPPLQIRTSPEGSRQYYAEFVCPYDDELSYFQF